MDQNIVKNLGDKPVVICEYMADLLVSIPSKNATLTNDAPPIHVGASPKEQTALSYKRAFMAMMKEKMMNELQSWNMIADRMKADDLFPESATISWDELLEFVSKMEGQVVPPSLQ